MESKAVGEKRRFGRMTDSKNRAGSIDCSFLWSWETVGDRALEALERMS